MNEIVLLRMQVEAMKRELDSIKASVPYRVLGNSVEFDKILIAKNRLVVPEKNQDSNALNGEIIVTGSNAFIRAGDAWRGINNV